jgi:V/A-type H+-transporting ATPase subunit D
MAEQRGQPPGRAGRLWLQSRLRTAHLAADLLERKLRVLRAEQVRLAAACARTASRWQQSWRAADEWAARAAFLSGGRELRLSAPSASAELVITWTVLVGARYPSAVACRPAEPAAGDRGPGGAASLEAAGAFRTALTAAAAHAVAAAAQRRIDAEVATTRRRLRAISDRRVPALDTALRARERDLDENERAENVRLRWAALRGSVGT